MDPEALEAKLVVVARLGRLPKIEMPVHFAGQSYDMARIAALARRFGLMMQCLSLKDEDGVPLSVPRRPSCGRSISVTQLSGLMMAEHQAAAAERPTKFPKLPSPRV